MLTTLWLRFYINVYAQVIRAPPKSFPLWVLFQVCFQVNKQKTRTKTQVKHIEEDKKIDN